MKHTGKLILTIALLMFAAITARAADDTVVVKLERLKSGHLAVQVKINGKGPYRLGFDTGSPPTFISSKLAEELGLLGDAGARPMQGAGVGAGGGRPATVDLEVGDVKRSNFPLMVLDHPTVQQMSRAMGDVEGLVGFNFFKDYRMTIDYEKQEFTFKPLANYGRGTGWRPAPQGRAVVFGATTEEPGAGVTGVNIKTITKGSAADQAGLKTGDRITSINDRWVTGTGDFNEALAALAPGLPARVKVSRAGKDLELTVQTRPGI